MQPLVSVLIPVFNRPAFLLEAVESVRAQTYPNWNVVVVDDHSTDDTLATARRAFADEPRVRVVSRQGDRGGAPVCRNQALAQSAGELVIFLDSDDRLAPHCLSQRVSYMQDHPDLDFAVFPVWMFHQQPGDSPLMFNQLEGGDDLDRFLRRDMPWCTYGPIWRREALDRVAEPPSGPWDERLPKWQDWELHIRALCRGLRYQKVDRADAYCRKHDQPNIGKVERGTRRYPEILAGLERVSQMLEEANLMNARRRAILAGNCFRLADAAVRGGEPEQALATWRWARRQGWAGPVEHLETAAVLGCHRWEVLYRLGRQVLARRRPTYFAVAGSRTHLRFTPSVSAVTLARGSQP